MSCRLSRKSYFNTQLLPALLLLQPESEEEVRAKESLVGALNARGRIPPALYTMFIAGELGMIAHFYLVRYLSEPSRVSGCKQTSASLLTVIFIFLTQPLKSSFKRTVSRDFFHKSVKELLVFLFFNTASTSYLRYLYYF